MKTKWTVKVACPLMIAGYEMATLSTDITWVSEHHETDDFWDAELSGLMEEYESMLKLPYGTVKYVDTMGAETITEENDHV